MHYVNIAWGCFSIGKCLFYSFGSKRIKKGDFVSDGFWKNKNPFFIGLSSGKNKDFEHGKKNSIAVGSSDGWDAKNLRSNRFYLIGW